MSVVWTTITFLVAVLTGWLNERQARILEFLQDERGPPALAREDAPTAHRRRAAPLAATGAWVTRFELALTSRDSHGLTGSSAPTAACSSWIAPSSNVSQRIASRSRRGARFRLVRTAPAPRIERADATSDASSTPRWSASAAVSRTPSGTAANPLDAVRDQSGG